MDNKFFTFIKPYLSFIDKGDFFRKPFSWLYIAFAVLNLILPFYILYTAIDNNIFDTFYTPAKFIIVFILVWIVIAFASWVCFQLWWDRKNKVTETSVENSEFVVTPVFAHFIQTFGEWIGTWIGIVGFFVALLAILGSDAVYLTAAIGVPFIQSGIASIILIPIYGFLIVVGSRFLAEMCRALASIANNTKKN
jgi:hypothetical protein